MKNLIRVWTHWVLSLFLTRDAQKVCMLACKVEQNDKEGQKYANKKEMARRWRR